MIANFKKDNENKIIITGADSAEALLLAQLVANSKLTTKELVLTEFYDVNGDVNGITIEIKDKAAA
jgi:hypothetical protein